MRHLLALGPLPWNALGVSPTDWRDCEVHEAFGEYDAIRRLLTRAFDVIVTNPLTPADRDIEIVREARDLQPGIRPIVIAPELTPDDIIAALRADVYAAFTMPVVAAELNEAVNGALDAEDWKNGIQVLSALPEWISLRVTCRRLTADRLTHFISQLAADVPEIDRFALVSAFREMLLNAMEHGAGFDPEKVVDVSAMRTARAIVYYFKDPGRGFNPKAVRGVAKDDDPISHLEEREALGIRPGGFGLMITTKMVDEVHYNEFGNEVILVKHLDQPHDA
jgi:anti-sigma regulatory factor (Ser/Thr protein kinase)